MVLCTLFIHINIIPTRQKHIDKLSYYKFINQPIVLNYLMTQKITYSLHYLVHLANNCVNVQVVMVLWIAKSA